MPLLRPLGRNESDYNAFDLVFAEHTGSLPGSPKDWRSRCCELWVQVGEAAEASTWQAIQDWLRTRPHAKAWRSRREALWQPLSASHDDCQYAETAKAPRQGHGRYAEAERFLSSLSQDDRACFLKVVWYRATEVLAQEAICGDLACDIDPREEAGLARLYRLVSDVIGDFAPAHYGLPHASQSVDPSTFCASHMAVYAMNAVTRARVGEQMMWPHEFKSRTHYLRRFTT